MSGYSPPFRKRHAKLFHKKTRTGCQRCRIRRVKCDEAKPVCSNCTRLGLECGYNNAIGQVHGSQPALTNADSAETEARRKLELELFYHYATETAASIGIREASKPIWGPMMCESAFKSDAVMNSVILLSALHKLHKARISGCTDDQADLIKISATYLNLTLRAHNYDLNNLSAANVDYACLTSNALRVYDSVRMKDRSLDPYVPPVDWLRMTGSTHIIFVQALELAKENPGSIGSQMISSSWYLLEERDSLQHTDVLEHLLRREEPYELAEPWDDETSMVYKTTLSLIGGIWKLRHSTKPSETEVLPLAIFPMLLEDEFVGFVEEKRPRALAALAHFFVMLHKLHSLWYIGNAGFREAWAIIQYLPEEWRSKLREPIEMLEASSVAQLENGVIMH